MCALARLLLSLNLSSERPPPPDDSGHLFTTRKVLRSTPGMQWVLDKVSSGGTEDDLVEGIIISPDATSAQLGVTLDSLGMTLSLVPPGSMKNLGQAEVRSGPR